MKKHASIGELKETLFSEYQKLYKTGVLRKGQFLSKMQTIQFVKECYETNTKVASSKDQETVKRYPESVIYSLISGEKKPADFYNDLCADMDLTHKLVCKILRVLDSFYAKGMDANYCELNLENLIQTMKKKELNLNTIVLNKTMLIHTIEHSLMPSTGELSSVCDVNKPDISGKTPLAYVIDMCKEAEFEWYIRPLICRGADINDVTNTGVNALIYAVQQGNAFAIKFFADKKNMLRGGIEDVNGVALDLRENGYQGDIPSRFNKMHYALLTQSNNAFKVLQETFRLDLDVKDVVGNTALMYAATSKRFASTFKYLIEKGVDLNQQNKQGQTALMIALQCGNFKAVSDLLNTEIVDIQLKDKEGKNIFDYVQEYTMGSMQEKLTKYLHNYETIRSANQNSISVFVRRASVQKPKKEDKQNA